MRAHAGTRALGVNARVKLRLSDMSADARSLLSTLSNTHAELTDKNKEKKKVEKIKKNMRDGGYSKEMRG